LKIGVPNKNAVARQKTNILDPHNFRLATTRNAALGLLYWSSFGPQRKLSLVPCSRQRVFITPQP